MGNKLTRKQQRLYSAFLDSGPEVVASAYTADAVDATADKLIQSPLYGAGTSAAALAYRQHGEALADLADRMDDAGPAVSDSEAPEAAADTSPEDAGEERRSRTIRSSLRGRRGGAFGAGLGANLGAGLGGGRGDRGDRTSFRERAAASLAGLEGGARTFSGRLGGANLGGLGRFGNLGRGAAVIDMEETMHNTFTARQVEDMLAGMLARQQPAGPVTGVGGRNFIGAAEENAAFRAASGGVAPAMIGGQAAAVHSMDPYGQIPGRQGVTLASQTFAIGAATWSFTFSLNAPLAGPFALSFVSKALTGAVGTVNNLLTFAIQGGAAWVGPAGVVANLAAHLVNQTGSTGLPVQLIGSGGAQGVLPAATPITISGTFLQALPAAESLSVVLYCSTGYGSGVGIQPGINT